MSRERRYVFDTNTVISALLLDQSVPAQAFYTALDDGEILASRATFEELSGVLGREKFARYVTREEIEQFLVEFLREVRLVEIAEEIRSCRDPKDNKFLELAVNGGASCLVSGDQDLLVLHPFRRIPILTPAQFLEWLRTPAAGG